MLQRFVRFASHHPPAVTLTEHIAKVEAQVAEAQKEWNKGERMSGYHAIFVFAGIGFLYSMSKAKEDKEHFITKYIAHHMTSNIETDKYYLDGLLKQQYKAESRLLLRGEKYKSQVVADPYLSERGSPFN